MPTINGKIQIKISSNFMAIEVIISYQNENLTTNNFIKRQKDNNCDNKICSRNKKCLYIILQ